MSWKKYMIILLIVFCALVLTAVSFVALSKSRYKKEVQELKINNPDFSKLTDGFYNGSFNSSFKC